MLDRCRILVALLAVLACAGGVAVASAKDKNAERVFTVVLDPAGNPEGVAFDKRSKDFFVSITADGAIYRGTLDSERSRPSSRVDAGQSAIGLEIRRGKLYVAGGRADRSPCTTSPPSRRWRPSRPAWAAS